MKYLDPRADLTFKKVFGELPEFKPQNVLEKKMLRFLTETEGNVLVDDELQQDPHIGKALGIVEESSYTEDELYYYDRYWDSVNCEVILVNDGFRKGEAKGLEQELQKGQRNARFHTVAISNTKPYIYTRAAISSYNVRCKL